MNKNNSGIFLFILSIVASMIIIPVGLLYGFFKQIYRQQFFKSFTVMNKKFYDMATGIDRYSNVACAELLNDTLIKKESVNKFGDGRESVSSVIGRNVLEPALKKLGIWINNKLSQIDSNHSVKNIGY